MPKPLDFIAVSRWIRTVLIGIVVAESLAACPQDPLADARASEDRGDHRAAAEAYLEAAKRDPALLAAWDGAVRIWCREHVDVARCLGVLDYELELLGPVPRHADALSESLEARARARMEKGLIDPALDDLLRAERAAPERASVRITRAEAYLMRGQTERARAELETAAKLDPRAPGLGRVQSILREAASEKGPPPFGR